MKYFPLQVKTVYPWNKIFHFSWKLNIYVTLQKSALSLKEKLLSDALDIAVLKVLPSFGLFFLLQVSHLKSRFLVLKQDQCLAQLK